MSHFTVLVIGENPEDQLAPFQENNMGDCPKEFLKWIDSDGHYHDTKEEAIKNSEAEDDVWQENPNKKWDWYSLGGRWTGFFKLKEGAIGDVGIPGVFGNQAPIGYADQCLKSAIDFEFMEKEAFEKASSEWEYANNILSGLPEHEFWRSIGHRMNYSQEAREIYHSQPRVVAWSNAMQKSGDSWPFGWSTSADELSIPKDRYVASQVGESFSTYAVIKDGKWYAKGEMGWFGMSHDESDEWPIEFKKLIDGLPEDTILSVYDCHI